MDVKKEMRIVTYLFLLFVACIAEDQLDGGYIFTSPRSIKLGTNNELQVLRFGAIDEGFLKVKLFYSESYNGNETLAKEQEFKLEKGESDTLLDFFVNTINSDNVYNGRLEINGTIDGECISGSDKVYFSTPKENIYLIQTDKPIYKPGQEVKFRVLKLDRNLKPSDDEDDIAEVYVEDPKGTRLFQFKGISLGKGIQQMQFPLADEPVLGNWRITVSNKNATESQTFEVKEYVLPKYDVTIKFPPFVLANAEKFDVEICAKYTYGKPVKGILNLNTSLERYSYSRDKTPVLQESIKIDGCYNYTVNISLIEPDNVYRYRRIMVVANVVEDGTGVQKNATEYLQRQYSPLNLNFNTEQNYRQYYKPGLPYNGKLKVTNPDDSPAAGEPVEICATISRKRIILGWLANKKVKYCSNYTSDDNGYIKYTLARQSTDAESVQLEAKSLKYARDSQYSGSRLDSLNQPSTGMSLSPFFSPSGSFIQLETIESAIPCGTQKNIRLLFTSKENTEFDLYYKIIRQGNVIQTGTKSVNFNTEDDVSKKFENDDELINDSETQLVPAPSDNDSSNNDEECQSAKEVKYIPPIGEVDIPVDVDATLSPSFTLLVFYVREDRETVADSQKIEVQKCFKNEVEFQFGDEVKQPGTKTSITVKSSPNSLCGLKVVDKSVSLLNSNDQLTKDKIFQIIDRMDSGIYYSNNPCNEKIPQPGLYSTKATSIIRPPGPWASSSYEDALSAFRDAGYLVISNLKLFTRPCTSGGGFDNGPIYQAESFSSHGVRMRSKKKGHAVALASTARRPAAPAAAGFAADSKIGVADVSATKSVVDVRNYFPETWLFEMQEIGPDGVYVTKETLPHTITEWVGSALCVNSEDGLGLSNTTTIKGFQAFFISYTLPYSVIRGEEFTIVMSIFSYADAALPITVSLDESEEFTVISDSINGDICIQPDTSENLRIKVKATTVGTVNITVRAETAASNDVCGSSTVYDGLAKDAITQSFEVEAEGFPTEKVESILFCPTDEEDQTFKSTLGLSLPDDVVPDSSRAVVDVTGNVMGPAIENLDNLVRLPTGCGEQNMVKFTPNYLVLDYLSDIGKLTDKIKSQAVRNLNTGYQRELTYRHIDGSFSAFGQVDKQGSMFLTAFVLKSFYEAKRYITIDNSIITDAQNWIASKQQADGCFPNVGQIIDHGIQGGLEKEKNNGAITAYVVSALIISKYENETVINNAMTCLNEDAELKPYDSFVYAYAQALAGKTEAARKRIDDVRPNANKTGGIVYYRNPNGSQSLNLETAAYAVLTELSLGSSASDVLGLVRYLTSNLNPRGGFYSTQDTCVGLDALSKFAKLVYADPVDILAILSGSFDEKIEISQDNKLLVQRNLVTNVPGELQVEATGSGCGLIQVALRYNTISPPQKQSFYLEVVGECTKSDCKQRKITVITSYIPSGQASGMSVVQVKMVTGTVPVKESLDKLKADKNNKILRVDVENNEVIFYLPEVTNQGVQFSFDVEEIVEVDNPQPGSAKVFDYYATENSASSSYSFGNSDISESSPASGSTEP
ncbi:alpha-1-inhibitor 3-like isoform X3 [Argiope bruennichi]|uniref:alpha-1-inhibitor 3-like isoform X3 n=1 Tax=Argiope bruennichi TaxID=94029 RepID=UPI0024953054|nr:alpha-1-inhibitor 3-like isoform X3 [Argiope bruennichi]